MPDVEISSVGGKLPGEAYLENYPGTLAMEVFRAGSYGAKGSFTTDDLDAIVADYNPALFEAPVTIDHVQSGAALGWVSRLWRDGDSLWAELKDVSQRLVDMVRAGRVRHRSAEIVRKLDQTGRRYFSGITFLGAAKPHVLGMAVPQFSDVDSPPETFTYPIPRDLWSGENAADKFDGEPHNSEDKEAMPTPDAAVNPPIDSAPAATAGTNTDERISEFARENQTLKAQLAELQSKFAQAQFAADLERFSNRLDALVSDGKATPFERDAATEIYSAIRGGRETVKFSADADAKEHTIADALVALFADRPVNAGTAALQKEITSAKDGADAEERTSNSSFGNDVSRRLAKRADEIVAASNGTLTFAQALIRASSENKAGATYGEDTPHA